MNDKELRDEISKIFIRWNMPTRQIAISEIIELFKKYGKTKH